MAGKFSASGASSVSECVECVNGKYSSEGAAYCSTAEAGKKIIKVGGLRVGVAECDINTFSTGAEDDCEACDGGHSGPGSSSCQQTQPGQYFNETLQQDVDCPLGKFSSTGAACVDCSDGFIATHNKSSHCSVCQPGTISNPANTECTECPLGHISGTAASECDQCEEGKFNDKEGGSECKLCDEYVKRSTTNITGATSVTNCFCNDDFYQHETECKEKMEGVSVEIGKSTLKHLPIEPGFWRTTNRSIEVKSCIVAGACVGR